MVHQQLFSRSHSRGEDEFYCGCSVCTCCLRHIYHDSFIIARVFLHMSVDSYFSTRCGRTWVCATLCEKAIKAKHLFPSMDDIFLHVQTVAAIYEITYPCSMFGEVVRLMCAYVICCLSGDRRPRCCFPCIGMYVWRLSLIHFLAKQDLQLTSVDFAMIHFCRVFLLQVILAFCVRIVPIRAKHHVVLQDV